MRQLSTKSGFLPRPVSGEPLNEELLEAEVARKKNPKRLQALKIKISPVFDCRIFSKSALPIAARGITRIDLSRLGLEIQFLASDVLLQ